MKRIARVFPTKTKMSPDDPDAYFGEPDLFTPQYNEVHISVTFTWDIKKAERLKNEWDKKGRVRVGGCALGDRGDNFISGLYLRKGITITSRGCPNNCGFCFVPKREGKIRELPIVEGNIIQDNNLLACSWGHLTKVFKMLKTQKHIDFSGGFESGRVTDKIIEQLRGLSIYQIWLAYDHLNADKPLRSAVNKLSKYFKRDKIRCYVLIGYEGDNLEKAEQRLRRTYEIGALPFAMRYRTPKSEWNDTYLFKERAWNLLTRQWTRPAIIKSILHKGGWDERNYC
jgi:hypothetical protein